MSRITSLSPTSSYSLRADLIESDEDISICSTPRTQPADRDPRRPSPSFPARPTSPVPRDCTASLTEASSTFSEPTPAAHIPTASRVCPSLPAPPRPSPIAKPSSLSSPVAVLAAPNACVHTPPPSTCALHPEPSLAISSTSTLASACAMSRCYRTSISVATLLWILLACSLAIICTFNFHFPFTFDFVSTFDAVD